MRRLLLGGALALIAGSATAQSWKDYPAVSNTSSVEADGDRVLQLSVVVPAPPSAVWEAFTTGEGYKGWAAPVAEVDFRVGGIIETSYDPASQPGRPGNIKNQIVAYVPERLLAIRNVQTPPGFRGAEAFGRTSTVVQFEPAGTGATKVTLTNAGYGRGEDFDAVYRHFEWGNAYSLDQLKKRFEAGPVNWAERFAKSKSAIARTDGGR